MVFEFLKRHKVDVYIVLALFLLALLPRVLDLGTFLTADEKTWIGRSYEFIRAFKDLRFNDMLQTTHPGVTTLWAVGTTVTAKMVASSIPFTNALLFHFVKSSQFSVALLNTLAIPGMYALLRLVFKRRDIPLLSALLLSLNPLLIGYSRVVHVDALLGSFLTLAVLASIMYARSLTRGYLIASAVLSCLALLTKFPAVFIFPFILFALTVFHGKKMLSISFLKDRSRDALIWILFVVLLILIIWPALLWVPNPVGNVLQLKRDISVAAATPHDMNEDYTLNAHHYPAAILDRSHPIALLGGAIGLIGIAVSLYKRKVSKEAFLVATYFIGFIVMMTLGAKKGDRYIIPAFFALDVLTAYGIFWFISLFKGEKRQKNGTYVAYGVSVMYLLFVVVSYHPYAIAYSNPLFPDNLSQELGWGEGLDQVATWLNANHPNATVASWYPGELGAFTTATVLHINAHQQNQVQFIVLYNNMFGREPSHYANDFIDEYYTKWKPVFTVQVAGKEYAWVYEKPSYGKTVGDLDDSMIAIQEVVVDHEQFQGMSILPATRFGEAKTGVLTVAVSKTLNGTPLFTQRISLGDIPDAAWYLLDVPGNLNIQKGQHLFISMRVVGGSAPYASIRYTPDAVRSTPVYISRTGNAADATQKPGSLGVQLHYMGTDGKTANELQVKLLK